MKKHGTDHTGSPSTGASTRERSKRTYSVRGGRATQPTAWPPSYASSPGGGPSATSLRNARRLGSPDTFPSELVRRGHMHQQPAHAPRGPKSRSRSSHRPGVSGWIAKVAFGLAPAAD